MMGLDWIELDDFIAFIVFAKLEICKNMKVCSNFYFFDYKFLKLS